MTGSAPSPSPLPTREQLCGGAVETLSRGGWGNSDVLLVETARGKVVVKDFAGRARWFRPVASWLLRRELRAYRQLEGHPNLPRVLGSLDALALCLEYRPGQFLSRSLRGKLPSGFLPELREALARMHASGVVHLDLRHRSNILADPDGHPVLIDFASSLCFTPGGVGARILLPLLAGLDRRALRKWEARLR